MGFFSIRRLPPAPQAYRGTAGIGNGAFFAVPQIFLFYFSYLQLMTKYITISYLAI